jgi:hypothetical protein
VAPGFNGADLAAIHHAGFGDHARHAAPFLPARLPQAGLRGGLVEVTRASCPDPLPPRRALFVARTPR